MNDQLNHSLNSITEKATSWWHIFVDMLPNLVIAAIILFIFNRIAKLTQKGFEKYFAKQFNSKSIAQLIGLFIKLGFIGLGLVIALSILGLDRAMVSILAGAGVAGLALGFALQNIVQNLISGILLSINKPFHMGELIEVAGITGTATKLTLKHTILTQLNGISVAIPNTQIFQGTIKNFSQNKERRLELIVGVAYDTDLNFARQTLIDAINELECVKKEKDNMIFAKEFADSSINFVVRYWIDLKKTSLADGTHQGVNAIHQAFLKANINIPFPIRTIIQ